MRRGLLHVVGLLAVCAFLGTTLAGVAVAQEQKCSLMLGAPEGWINLPEVAAKFGVPVFFVVEGFDFETSPAVMYARFWDAQPGQTLDALVEEDVRHFKEAYPEAKVTLTEELTKERRYIWLDFVGSGSNAYEQTVFTQFFDCFILFTLSATAQENLELAKPHFLEFISTTRPMVKVD